MKEEELKRYQEQEKEFPSKLEIKTVNLTCEKYKDFNTIHML